MILAFDQVEDRANRSDLSETHRRNVEERSYGSFYRSMFLPFEPEEGAVDAHFDKGVLHLTIKKPAKAVKTTKTIGQDIRRELLLHDSVVPTSDVQQLVNIRAPCVASPPHECER